MSAVEAFGPVEYLEAMTTAARVLEDHAVAIDRLRAPTGSGEGGGPTGGVGTDLSAALSAAVDAAEGDRDFSAICGSMERGAAGAARNRTGRGVVTLLAGIGEVLRNADRLDAHRFAMAMEAAAERMAPADDGRHPGSFAAVVGVVADGALAASDHGADLAGTILAAAAAGIEELERGPEADDRLAARGTVDPAAAGLLLVLDTLASVVTGEPLPTPPPEREHAAGGRVAGREVAPGELASAMPPGSVPLFEVSCILLPDEPGVEVSADLEEYLVVAGEIVTWEVEGTRWNVALRTPRPGAVVEALVEVGRPRDLHIGLSAPPGGPAGAGAG